MSKRMEINAYEDEAETMPVHNQKFYDENGDLVLTIDTNVDSDLYGSPRAGIKVNTPDNSRSAMITGNGLFSNAGKVQALPPSSGLEYNGSVVGLLLDKNSNINGIGAGVMGIDGTDGNTSGNAKSYGGFFNSLMAWGQHYKTIEVGSNYNMDQTDCVVSCFNQSGTITIALPPNPKAGRLAMIRRSFPGEIIINGNGKLLMAPGLVNFKGMGASGGQGDCAILLFTGSYWQFNRMRGN